MEELVYWIWMSSTPGLGSVKISRLLEKFKRPELVWKAGESQFKYVNSLHHQDIGHLCNKSLKRAEKIIEDARKKNIKIITRADPDYPERLKNIYDPPSVLFVNGEFPLKQAAAVAIVGSRKASVYGQNTAERLSYQLAQRGITVVSGMAKGIDTFAHKGALKAGGKTIAVLGCGPDVVYPKENKELMYYITKGGAVLSEYPPGTFPNALNFPARNRIISGLCCGVIVIEAGEKSGSLITADFAMEQGRDVFAVPGNIDCLTSKGSNNLIKQGAKPVTCVEDILEELPPEVYDIKRESESYTSVKLNTEQTNYPELSPLKNHNFLENRNLLDLNKEDCNMSEGHTNIHNTIKVEDTIYQDISSEEKNIMNLLSADPLHIDQLYRKLGCSIQKLNSSLTMLEMRGLISQLPGKYFIRNI